MRLYFYLSCAVNNIINEEGYHKLNQILKENAVDLRSLKAYIRGERFPAIRNFVPIFYAFLKGHTCDGFELNDAKESYEYFKYEEEKFREEKKGGN